MTLNEYNQTNNDNILKTLSKKLLPILIIIITTKSSSKCKAF